MLFVWDDDSLKLIIELIILAKELKIWKTHIFNQQYYLLQNKYHILYDGRNIVEILKKIETKSWIYVIIENGSNKLSKLNNASIINITRNIIFKWFEKSISESINYFIHDNCSFIEKYISERQIDEMYQCNNISFNFKIADFAVAFVLTHYLSNSFRMPDDLYIACEEIGNSVFDMFSELQIKNIMKNLGTSKWNYLRVLVFLTKHLSNNKFSNIEVRSDMKLKIRGFNDIKNMIDFLKKDIVCQIFNLWIL